MKVAITGANGQLGIDICETFANAGYDVVALTHDTLDITDMDAVADVLSRQSPEVLINTAAMHNLDACEADPMTSFKVNGVGAWNLARMANELKAGLIHISTDYVFDGQARQAYVETDLPCPINVYGNTKLSGEYFIQSTAHRYAIVRVSGLYGKHPCRAKGGLNFVQLMLKLASERDEVRVVDDEVLTPTSTIWVARQILKLVDSNAQGIFHATCQGSCSWYEFARTIFELSQSRVRLNVADPAEFPAKVPRPKFSVLENHNLKALGIDIMPHWKEALKQYLENRLSHD